MSGRYSKYNRAVSSDPQLKQVEQQAKKKYQESSSQLNQAEKNIQRGLQSAVLKNEDVDRSKVTAARKEISSQRSELKESIAPIKQERKKIEKAKKQFKSPEDLENRGYKKEEKGGKVVYYKEDTYKRKKGDERKYRKEEYIFNSKGEPVKIVVRTDGRRENSDKKFIYEREVTEFKNGLVKRYEENREIDGRDERDYVEFYDSKGRILEEEYYRDGDFDREKKYRYNDNTGKITIKEDTAETRAARAAKRKAEDKFWSQWNKAYWKAKEQGIDISVDGDRNKSLDSKAKEFNKQYNKGIKELNEVHEIRVKTEEKGNKDIKTTKYKNKEGDLLRTTTETTTYTNPNLNRVNQVLNSGNKKADQVTFDMSNIRGGVPGVNQGTDTSNIPKIDLNFNSQPKPQNTIGPARKPTAAEINRAIEYDQANPVKKFFMKDWTAETDKYWERQSRASSQGTNDYDALVLAMGTGVISGAQKTGQALRVAVTQNPITTASNVVTALPEIPGRIVQRAQQNPAGFIGEVAFEVVGAKGASKGFSAARNALRPAKVTESPANIRTTMMDDTIRAESSGNFQVESGLIKRTNRDFTFESTGNLNRVNSINVADEVGSNRLRLNQDMQKLLRDSPDTIKFTERSTEVSPFVRSRTSRVSSSNVRDATPSKEVFRGEIETKIKDSKGNVVRTEKQQAELQRMGQKQTLYVNGRPYDIQSEMIDTPKGVGVSDLGRGVTAFTREGAYGFDPGRQTIRTTTTDPKGNQKVSLSQRDLDVEKALNPGPQDRVPSFKQISQDQQRLLSNAPYRDVFDSSSRALTNPTIQARKRRGSAAVRGSEIEQDIQTYSGVSFNAQREALRVSKQERNIVDGVVTGEKDLPRELGYKQPTLTQQQTKRLETADASQERLYREVFGNDFINDAKAAASQPQRSRSVNDFSMDPFANMKTPGFDQSQMFKNQQSKFKTATDLFAEKPKSPTSRSSSQQSIFMDQPKTKAAQMPKSKNPNLQQTPFNPAAGVDFSKSIPKRSPRGFSAAIAGSLSMRDLSVPGMAQSQNSQIAQGLQPGQNFQQFTNTKQTPGQSFIPGVDMGFFPGMAQGNQTAQATSQTPAPGFPGVPPVTIPGVPTSPPGAPPRVPKAGSSKPAPKQSSPRKKPTNSGEYIGSLTGALLGKTTKKDIKNLTGLEVRPTKIRGKK